MPIDRPERADQQPEQPERPELLQPRDRADLERLSVIDERWKAIGGYEGERANLPNPDKAEAVQYIKENRFERPWLFPASYEPADTQRVIASMDQGNGHQLERHEGHATDERLQRRVTALEDPRSTRQRQTRRPHRRRYRQEPLLRYGSHIDPGSRAVRHHIRPRHRAPESS